MLRVCSPIRKIICYVALLLTILCCPLRKAGFFSLSLSLLLLYLSLFLCFVCFILFHCCFQDRVSLCNPDVLELACRPGWPPTLPPSSELKVCTIMPDLLDSLPKTSSPPSSNLFYKFTRDLCMLVAGVGWLAVKGSTMCLSWWFLPRHFLIHISSSLTREAELVKALFKNPGCHFLEDTSDFHII